METLSELVRSLAVTIILASLLEMFLPSNDMKRFVQVIVGLFILVTILTPLLGLLNKEWTTELQAWTTESKGVPLEQILARGEQIRQENQAQAMEQYRQKLAAQVAGLANLVSGVEVRNVRVEVNGQEGLPGKVSKIQLTVAPAGKDKLPAGRSGPLVHPVEIDLGKGGGERGLRVSGSTEAEGNQGEDAVPEQAVNQLKNTLANLYGIRPEAVEIKEIKEGKSSVR